jgi:hypothetical protein
MDPEDAQPLESRPPTKADLLLLCRSLKAHAAKYLIVGGFTMMAHGLMHATGRRLLAAVQSPLLL